MYIVTANSVYFLSSCFMQAILIGILTDHIEADSGFGKLLCILALLVAFSCAAACIHEPGGAGECKQTEATAAPY